MGHLKPTEQDGIFTVYHKNHTISSRQISFVVVFSSSKDWELEQGTWTKWLYVLWQRLPHCVPNSLEDFGGSIEAGDLQRIVSLLAIHKWLRIALSLEGFIHNGRLGSEIAHGSLQ